MLSQTYIAFAILAVGVFTIYMAAMHLFRSNNLSKKVKNVKDSSILQEEDEEENTPTPIASFCIRIVQIFKLTTLAPADLAISLSRAGITSPNATTYYLFSRYVAQPFFMLLAINSMYKTFFIAQHSASAIITGLFITATYTLIGMRGTQIYIQNRKAKRHQSLTYAFPEVLDLLLVCIESGLGLDAALNRVCKEMRTMYPDMVGELDRTRLELTMLNDRVVALQNLAERTEIVPFRTLVSALIQTERFGTSLVDTLRVLAEELRTTRIFAAEQKAARIPVLITLPLIICIMPAFIMIIIAPPIIKVIANGGIMGQAKAGR